MLSTSSATGTSLRELMERMGHSSTRAALIYQRASRERDEAIASALGEAFAKARQKGPSGEAIGHATGTKAGESVMISVEPVADSGLTWRFALERAKGIEPS